MAEQKAPYGVRVCVVESQLTGAEFSFLYSNDEAWDYQLGKCLGADRDGVVEYLAGSGQDPMDPWDGAEGTAEDYARGNYNWMSAPAPDAEE